MDNEKRITQAFENAKEVYASYGINVNEVLDKFDTIPISIPCWQGDDIIGFESAGAGQWNDDLLYI